MSAIVPIILSLLVKLVPLAAGSSPLIGEILTGLIQIVPVIIQEAKDLAPMVKAIIATLKGDPAVTADQLAQLDAMDKQVDDAFDAAATAAQAEDSAGAG